MLGGGQAIKHARASAKCPGVVPRKWRNLRCEVGLDAELDFPAATSASGWPRGSVAGGIETPAQDVAMR